MWLMIGISVGVAVLTVLVIAGKRRVTAPPARTPTTATAFLPALCHGPIDFIDDDLPTDVLADYEEPAAGDTLYLLDRAPCPWAEYGQILIHGITARLGRHPETTELQLERSGPYVPPITMPCHGGILVTDSVRHAMQGAGFTGLTFRPVHLAKVVEIPWHSWDLCADRPPYTPQDGVPENYLHSPPHCERMAEMMPPIWELIATPGLTVISGTDLTPDADLRYVTGSWNRLDAVTADVGSQLYLSPRAARWITAHFGRWVRATALPTIAKAE